MMEVIGVAEAASVAEEARTVTWLRFIILASMILNALLLILPGALVFGNWLINTYSNTGTDADAAELVFGVGSFGYGMLNRFAPRIADNAAMGPQEKVLRTAFWVSLCAGQTIVTQ